MLDITCNDILSFKYLMCFCFIIALNIFNHNAYINFNLCFIIINLTSNLIMISISTYIQN